MNKRLQDSIQALKKSLSPQPTAPRPGAVATINGKSRISDSPKATGIAGKFSLGKTRTGKPIQSYPEHTDHKAFTPSDHMDAYKAHASHVSNLDPSDTHPGLIKHHKNAMQSHFRSANSVTEKSFHRRTKMGKTRSGKEIHSNQHPHHVSHDDWSRSDHIEASLAHNRRAMRVMDAISHFSTKKEGRKMVAVLQKILKKHATNAHGHHTIARSGH